MNYYRIIYINLPQQEARALVNFLFSLGFRLYQDFKVRYLDLTTIPAIIVYSSLKTINIFNSDEFANEPYSLYTFNKEQLMTYLVTAALKL